MNAHTQATAREAVEQTPMVFQCCGRTLCDGTDCPNKGPWAQTPAWRMSGYYYSFDATGNAAVDRILSAVGCAGKAYHHTEDWNDQANPAEQLRGDTPVEWIQNAAIDAAEFIAAKQEEVERLMGDLRASEEDRLKLHKAAIAVLAYRNGDLPTRGWLRDNDASRKALSELAAALSPSQQGGPR